MKDWVLTAGLFSLIPMRLPEVRRPESGVDIAPR